MRAEELLATVEELGVVVSVDGDGLLLRPKSRVPEGLIPELRARKSELRYLVELRGWPEASRDAVRRFGVPEARLYPFLKGRVTTPDGAGVLLQVFAERTAVALDAEPGRVAFFLPSEVVPPDVEASARITREGTH